MEIPKRKISASIVLYNTNLKQLNDVINSFSPSENRILYIIDNSIKKTNTEKIKYLNNIQYYFTGANKGYGAGHNIAIKMAIDNDSQYHVVLNTDLIFEPNIINKIVNFMDSDLSIGQVMPKILSPNGDLQYLCKLLPTPADLLLKRFLPKKYKEKYMKKFQLKFTSYNNIMNVPYLSGCFMFFRVSCLKSIGIFDERFFMYPEDIDITRRMHKLFKTLYYPEVSIIHIHASESYKKIKLFLIHVNNIIKYFNKWGWFFDKERNKINKETLLRLKRV